MRFRAEKLVGYTADTCKPVRRTLLETDDVAQAISAARREGGRVLDTVTDTVWSSHTRFWSPAQHVRSELAGVTR